MGTDDVKIDPKLNVFLWSKGIRKVPKRVRLRMIRQPKEEEDEEHRLYTLVEHVPVKDNGYKGLLTKAIQI